MDWQIAKLAFQIVSPLASGASQFDEQIRLIQANNKFSALSKIKLIAHNEEQETPDIDSSKVSWKFVAVLDLQHLGELNDGAKIYYSISETDDTARYIYDAKLRETYIEQKLLPIFAT